MAAMNQRLVDFSVRGGVAWLELTNPPMNCSTHEMMRDLDDAILHARFADEVHVVVIRGAGEEAFSAGSDLNMLNAVSPSFKHNFYLHAEETLGRLERSPKLVIAAVNGHAVGGGFEIALAADIRIVLRNTALPPEKQARIALPEATLGLLPSMGGTQRLPRLVGKALAIELMATGETIPLDRAQALGLVNHVWECAGVTAFVERVQKYAEGFCPPGRAAHAIGLIKSAVQAGADVSLERALALERELQQQLFLSDDAREGLSAFLAHRKPDFTGR